MSIRKLYENSQIIKEPDRLKREADNYAPQLPASVFSPMELQMLEFESFVASAKLPERNEN